MNRVLIIFIAALIGFSFTLAQEGFKEKDKDEEYFDLEKIFGIQDRAGGTHDASNIGLFFENRGKLYPRRLTQGPSGEFPINSGKHYIYRINPIVGIPGNVIQGRYTTNEEWEAASGYQNPDLAQISFSDNPDSWHPVNGWPVKNANGDPLFLSDQDSYCAYNDSNNTISILGIQMDQIGYTYGVNFAKDMIFYKYILTNNSTTDYNDFYFSLYVDCDLGNISGGVPEYNDDKIGFIKEDNFMYYYDSDGYSSEWPGGNVGMMGAAFLKTPEVNGTELGITDMHYNEYYSDRDIDTIQYGIMSSSEALYNSSLGSEYFHPGSSGDIHYDDTSTVPSGGLDLVCNISSGPYTLNQGDSLFFYTAIIAGETKDELLENLEQAQKILDFNFEISKPPVTPTLYGFARDKSVSLYWDDVAENSKDNFSGEYDFEGYRVYRSLDHGITWEPLADFDKINDFGLDRGLQYSFIDDKVINGIEYWYSLTAYDRGDESLESLESPKGNNVGAKNLVVIIPVSDAIGRDAVSSGDVVNIGNGNSNYQLLVEPNDDESLSGNIYEVGFSYNSQTDKGKLRTQIIAEVVDSTETQPNRYGFAFKSPNAFDIIDMTTGDVLKEDNTYIPRVYPGIIYSSNGSVIPGIQVRIYDPNPLALADSLPKAGDFLSINYSVNVERNNTDTVIYNRPLLLERSQATSDGIIFNFRPPDIIQNVSRIGGLDDIEITFTVSDETEIQNALYIISVESSGFDTGGNGIISLSVKIDTVIAQFDSLANQDEFEFNGISGVLHFPNNDPPSPGNLFSVETVIPVKPNILDKYRFNINSASVDNSVVKNELNRIRVVPNPYVVSSLFEPEFGELRNEPLRQIQFINLPTECTIYIFSVNADLVKTLYHNSTNGTETWDLRAEGGREIAPGVYIYVVKTEFAEHIERFAVIK